MQRRRRECGVHLLNGACPPLEEDRERKRQPNDIMKKLKYLFLKLFSPKGIVSKPKSVAMPVNAKSFYDFKLRSIEGKEIDFSIYKGKKVLIMNTTS